MGASDMMPYPIPLRRIHRCLRPRAVAPQVYIPNRGSYICRPKSRFLPSYLHIACVCGPNACCHVLSRNQYCEWRLGFSLCLQLPTPYSIAGSRFGGRIQLLIPPDQLFALYRRVHRFCPMLQMQLSQLPR